MENGGKSINQFQCQSSQQKGQGHVACIQLGRGTLLQLFPTLRIAISLPMQISYHAHSFRSFWKWVGGPWESWVALFSPCSTCPLLGLILVVVLCAVSYLPSGTRTRMCVLDKCCPTFAWPPSAATSFSFSRWLHSHLAIGAGALIFWDSTTCKKSL